MVVLLLYLGLGCFTWRICYLVVCTGGYGLLLIVLIWN